MMGLYMKYCKYCFKELVNRREDTIFCDSSCRAGFRTATTNKEVFKLSDHDKMIRRKYKDGSS